MIVSEWLETRPKPSSALVEQLLHEKRDQMLIGDHLVTDDEIALLREYLASKLNEFSRQELPLADPYPSGITPPSNLFPF